MFRTKMSQVKLKKFFDRKEILKNEKEQKLSTRLFNVFLGNLARIIYIVENILCIVYLVKITDNNYFIFLIIFDIIILLDAIYISIFRDGKDFSWCSIFLKKLLVNFIFMFLF